MPQPAQADGPWGEAIRYWLNVRTMRQADLARETDIEAKTISSVTRGFHTTTRILQRIAEALEIPLDAVLVSPDRKSANEARKQMILEITEHVTKQVEAAQQPAPKPALTEAQQAAQIERDAMRAVDQAGRRSQKKRKR